MTAEASLSCPNGCFEINYRGSIDDPDVPDRDFVTNMGPPLQIHTNGNKCPNCKSRVEVDWNTEGSDHE